MLKVLKGRPVTHDHETAAMGLSHFEGDSDVSAQSFALLEEHIDRMPESLMFHLVMNCAALKDLAQRQRFQELRNDPRLPSGLSLDMDIMIKRWK
jgi:hypothetical protein